MLRTAAASVLLVLLAWCCGAWITRDFAVWTAEGARRLGVHQRPVEVPPATLAGPGVTGSELRTHLSGPGRATIVNFVYTRCPTVCMTLGSTFQQIQQALGETPASGVRLLSVSFDPGHDDAASLQRYAAQWRADPDLWTLATVPDAVQLQRLLDALQVVVIEDGWGGFEHNAALLVVDGQGRLVRIFDDTEADRALGLARAVAAGPGRE